MRRAFAIVCLLSVAALGTYTAYHTRVVYVDDGITLVTIDALPEHVVIVTSDPDHRAILPNDVRVTRVRPATVPPRADKQAPSVKWTLPFSCADAKYYHDKYSRERLEAMRIAAGQPRPTGDQLRQVETCLAGRGSP